MALRACALLIGSMVACLAGPLTARAQVSNRALPGGQLVRAHLTADLTSASDIAVQLHYTLQVDSGAERVPFVLLRWRGVSVDELQASTQGESVALQLADQGRRTSGWLELPGGLQPRLWQVELRYRVRVAPPFGPRLRIPVLALLWPPADARPGTFTADVKLRPEQRVSSAFPTSLRLVPASAGTQYRASLQVVPSVIAFSTTGARAELQEVTHSDAGPAPPGFVFWGLFVVLTGICVLYVFWFWWTERA